MPEATRMLFMSVEERLLRAIKGAPWQAQLRTIYIRNIASVICERYKASSYARSDASALYERRRTFLVSEGRAGVVDPGFSL
jgi:hypothetical protein